MTEGDDKVDLDDPSVLPGSRSGQTDPYPGEGGTIDLTDGSYSNDLSAAAASMGTPSVQAVVIAEHADPYLGEVLLSLGDQSYDELEVTVINATGHDDLERRFGRNHPFAEWVTMPSDLGFAALANWALTNVDEVAHPFLMIVRDDTALSAGAVSYLVEEMFRSNAGIVGPKLVNWNDPSKLLSVGYGADRRGRRIDLIESDEFDQDQYSAVSDVFLIPSGVQLIRTDLFAHLGGFDPVMTGHNEDLDLCWRAHAVAARVVVVPQATARIAQPIPSKSAALEQFRERSRHRLRTVAVTSGRWGFPATMVKATLSLVLSAIGNLLRGRPAYARAALGALPWNLTHLSGFRERRRHLRKTREVGDSEIHALQSRVGPHVGTLVEQTVRPTAPLADWARSLRRSLMDDRQRVGSAVAAFLGLSVLLMALGTWRLFGDLPVVAGTNPVLPSGPDLIDQWLSGYRASGLGGPAAAPLSFVLLGFLGAAFSWSPTVLHLILLVGPLVVAAIGTFRLVRPLGGPRAAAIATAMTVANPLPSEAFAAARWEVLVLWAYAPFLLASAAKLGDLEPWNATPRPLPTRLVRFGFLTAVGAAFAPAAIPLAIVAAIGVIIFGFASGRLFRVGYGAAGMVAALVVPAVLHLPITRNVLAGTGWDWVVGSTSPEQEFAGFAELLEFAPGRSSGSILMWGLLAAASLGLLFGRKGRFDAAVLGWGTAIAGFVVAWTAASFDTPPLPGADALLTLSGAGLSLAVGASARAVQIDLKRYGYGWRQFATVAAAFGGAAVLLLGFGKSLDGRYDHPEVGYAEITALLQSESDDARILWLGDPRVLPGDASTTLRSNVSFAISNGGRATIADRFLPTASDLNAEVAAVLEVAVDGDTVRLGRLLAPFGIDYVIYQPKLAPAPYEGPSFGIDPSLALALADQLDLRRQAGTLNLLVFRNEASSGSAVVVGDRFDPDAETIVELLNTDLSAARSVLPATSSPTSITFVPDADLVAGDQILVAQAATGWVPTGGASALTETVGGLTLITIEDPTTDFGLEYRSPPTWWLWNLLQLGFIAGALYVASRTDRPMVPTSAEPELTIDLRSDRQIARELDLIDAEREPVGDSL